MATSRHVTTHGPDKRSAKASSGTGQHEQLARLVKSKVEDGNLRAAVRILTSDDGLAESNESTFQQLLEKHPPANPLRNFSALPDRTATGNPLQVSEDDVRRTIRSFPAGSAGGPDGIRPQHLVDLLSLRETDNTLISSLTGFVNMIMRGQCPGAVAPILFGGNLTAILKKSGGIRPIAVGYYWRRLAAKCANNFATAKLSEYFSPRQLGAGAKGGCEAAVHSCRRFLSSMPRDNIIVKLDFANAFNTVRRDAMLSAVSELVPEIFPFCSSVYQVVPELKFGNRLVPSCEGIQQGDPLGPLLFCLTLHPILNKLSSDLVIGYMDDVTVGGQVDSVAKDVQEFAASCTAIGLELNTQKCELIAQSDQLPLIKPIGMDNFVRVPPDAATLLGAPLSDGIALADALSKKFVELSRGADRLSSIAAHDALTILRASISASRLTYILRSSPCVGHDMLTAFDKLFCSCLSRICNVDLASRHWTQASLPVRHGGLGIRSVVDLSSACFLASAASTKQMQESLLSRCFPLSTDTYVDRFQELWVASSGQPSVPIGPLAFPQKAWDEPLIAVKLSLLAQETAASSTENARFLAATSPHSGDWLHALPLSACGLRLDDNAVRVAIGMRLGVKVCEPHTCPCGTVVDNFGSHALSCKRNSGRTIRHSYLNDIIAHSLSRAGVPSTREPSGLSRTDGKRPDGVTQVPWQRGKCAIWDVTVADTLAPSYLAATSTASAAAAENASLRKEQKYSLLTEEYIFVPIAFESLGPMSQKAFRFLQEVGRRSAATTGDNREAAFLFQRVSVALQRFNAVMLMGSFEPQVFNGNLGLNE